jgi:DNA-binding response OmpR family regulator
MMKDEPIAPCILIVEDEIVIARDLQWQLEKIGFRVPAIATGAVEAIRFTREYQPDLVLMDINLGIGPDGVETARQLRNLAPVGVVYLTGNADVETFERARQIEPLGYLVKPFEIHTLDTTLKLALYKLGMERERERMRIELERNATELARKNAELEQANRELADALAQVKTLHGLLPICCVCHKIRDEENRWQRVENYVSSHSDAIFSHSYCPECAAKLRVDLETDLPKTTGGS